MTSKLENILFSNAYLAVKKDLAQSYADRPYSRAFAESKRDLRNMQKSIARHNVPMAERLSVALMFGRRAAIAKAKGA